MLPPGITADVLPQSELIGLRTMLPGAQTAAHLHVGPCSCDLIRTRHRNTREDERELRRRYAQLGLSRERIIGELERHRRKTAAVEPERGWRAALADFVAEHARNAGPTLYYLTFQPAGPETSEPDLVRVTVAQVRAGHDDWLREGRPVLVVR